VEPDNEPPPKKPDLALLISEAFPAGFEDDLLADLASGGASAASIRISSGPFAGLELYLPTAVALFVATSYFGGLIQKIAEGHYETLKGVAKKLYHRIVGVRVTPIGTVGKVSPVQKFSLSYSITGELAPKLNFKLILASEISIDEAEQGIDAFLDLIGDIHFGVLDPENLEHLLSYRPVGGIVLVTFDTKTRRIVPVDPTA
jgi:hypothetical protein